MDTVRITAGKPFEERTQTHSIIVPFSLGRFLERSSYIEKHIKNDRREKGRKSIGVLSLLLNNEKVLFSGAETIVIGRRCDFSRRFSLWENRRVLLFDWVVVFLFLWAERLRCALWCIFFLRNGLISFNWFFYMMICYEMSNSIYFHIENHYIIAYI